MKKAATALAAVALALWGMESQAHAQTKPKPKSIYVVCSVDFTTQQAALVSEVTTAAPVTLSASTVGPVGTSFFAVFQLTTATSCEALGADMSAPGPYPAGITLEAETTHKPSLSL